MFEISTRSAAHRQMEQNGDTRALWSVLLASPPSEDAKG